MLVITGIYADRGAESDLQAAAHWCEESCLGDKYRRDVNHD